MNFNLTSEQEMVRQQTKKFAEKEIAPYLPEIERTGAFPKELWAKMAKEGMFGIPWAEEYGGSGGDFISYMIATEEICAVACGIGAAMAVQVSLIGGALNKFGTHEQKLKYLVPLAKGEKIGFFATTEPNASSDVKGIQTKAVIDTDGYVLNGQKCMITNGGLADYGIVFANTAPGKLSAFIVETDTPGFSASEPEALMGNYGQQIFELYMEDVKVPKENLLGEWNHGAKVDLTTLDGGRLGVAMQAIGIARAALEESLKYMKTREQFGARIATFQSLQFYVSEMATNINAARWLAYHAALLMQNGLPFTSEASMAKWFASDIAAVAASKAVQIHGGYGFMKKYKVEQLYRNAKIIEIYEGTNEVMKMVIARSLLGREFTI